VAVKALPPKQYKADEGVMLVDRWAALRDQRLALEEQAEAIKVEEEAVQQELLAFTEQQNLETVVGSSCQAKVTQKVGLNYPKRGNQDRDRFESALREAGIWDEITIVNGQSLRSLWLDKEGLPPSSRQSLAPFIEETVERQIKLKTGGLEEE
jgi:hypothetical protein